MSGETPEYTPGFGPGGWTVTGSVQRGRGDVRKDGIDECGVEYAVVSAAPGQSPMPTPGKLLLHDIADWEQVIHSPVIPDDIDRS